MKSTKLITTALMAGCLCLSHYLSAQAPTQTIRNVLTEQDDIDIQVSSPFEFTIVHPGDLNGDGSVRVCLNPARSDCDYISDEVTPQQTLAINLPFRGQLVLPHEINYIYPSDLDPAYISGGLNEATNIYLENDRESDPGIARFRPFNGTQKDFSDYLFFFVDDVRKETIIRWNIPQEEGFFGDARNINLYGQSDWHMTFVLNGYPYFKHHRGSPVNFEIIITSEMQPYSQYYTPTLNAIEIVY